MKLLLPIALGSTLMITGCGAYQHDPESDHDQHGGNHHDNMMQDHHGEGHMMGGHAHSGESLAGKPGEVSEVSRVIEVTAHDSMRFKHEPLNIKDGETIKFVITNKGTMPHEFSIATKDEHMEHGEMMMKNPNMHHGPGGNTITVKPGETQELIWKFENAWQIEAACNIPGHYQAGMHSPVTVEE
ncbi:copper-binding protein [Oleiphilus messinensis]|uniref:Copper-binding protein n=1 Tax=Oleiphilus messinensis TaxID=141451 RepID=A0A1Y0IBL6_9GAMM|nr:cupredoxin family protein [Oleiphilus messinensis]ARU56773.1 copper-binding protein [Oleiphilus messinensis]